MNAFYLLKSVTSWTVSGFFAQNTPNRRKEIIVTIWNEQEKQIFVSKVIINALFFSLFFRPQLRLPLLAIITHKGR